MARYRATMKDLLEKVYKEDGHAKRLKATEEEDNDHAKRLKATEDDKRAYIKQCERVLRLLQLMCEGHFGPLQNHLRE